MSDIGNFSVSTLIKALTEMANTEMANRTGSNLTKESTLQDVDKIMGNKKIEDVQMYLRSEKCKTSAKDLLSMSDDELKAVRIDELLDLFAKDDHVEYIDTNNGEKPYTAFRISGEPTLPYIRRLEVVFGENGIKTVGDLFDKQKEFLLELNNKKDPFVASEWKKQEKSLIKNIFGAAVKSLDSSFETQVEKGRVPSKEQKQCHIVKGLFENLENSMSIDINVGNEDAQRDKFYEKIRGLATLAEQKDKEFESKKALLLKDKKEELSNQIEDKSFAASVWKSKNDPFAAAVWKK